MQSFFFFSLLGKELGVLGGGVFFFGVGVGSWIITRLMGEVFGFLVLVHLRVDGFVNGLGCCWPFVIFYIWASV